MNLRFLKTIVISALLAAANLSALAVTDKEMDRAKAIAAKEYLRWVNDGSGYLDEFEVSSTAELNSKLKAKEKENILKFNSVALPTDYPSWDKDKLVEYWSVTFFNSPGLDEKGKGAKARIKKKLQALTVSAPSSEAKSQETPTQAETAAQPSNAPETEATPENVIENAEQQDILSDQKAIENDAKLAEESRREEDSHTWVYIMVLAILVGVVIWLVVYAANLMKRQPGASKSMDSSEETANLKAQAKAAIEKKNEEIQKLRQQLENEESRSANLGMELERMKLENSRLLQQMQKLREQTAAIEKSPEAKRQTEQASVTTTRVEPAIKHVKQEDAPAQTPPAPVINTIYLGRANRRGIFVRADRRLNPGNTIYRLDTEDGMVGTFHVVDRPEVVDLALSNPTEYLAAGCTGEDFEDTVGVTRIVTESAGTAIFENGYWKVLRKSQIRYE